MATRRQRLTEQALDLLTTDEGFIGGSPTQSARTGPTSVIPAVRGQPVAASVEPLPSTSFVPPGGSHGDIMREYMAVTSAPTPQQVPQQTEQEAIDGVPGTEDYATHEEMEVARQMFDDALWRLVQSKPPLARLAVRKASRHGVKHQRPPSDPVYDEVVQHMRELADLADRLDPKRGDTYRAGTDEAISILTESYNKGRMESGARQVRQMVAGLYLASRDPVNRMLDPNAPGFMETMGRQAVRDEQSAFTMAWYNFATGQGTQEDYDTYKALTRPVVRMPPLASIDPSLSSHEWASIIGSNVVPMLANIGLIAAGAKVGAAAGTVTLPVVGTVAGAVAGGVAGYGAAQTYQAFRMANLNLREGLIDLVAEHTKKDQSQVTMQDIQDAVAAQPDKMKLLTDAVKKAGAELAVSAVADALPLGGTVAMRPAARFGMAGAATGVGGGMEALAEYMGSVAVNEEHTVRNKELVGAFAIGATGTAVGVGLTSHVGHRRWRRLHDLSQAVEAQRHYEAFGTAPKDAVEANLIEQAMREAGKSPFFGFRETAVDELEGSLSQAVKEWGELVDGTYYVRAAKVMGTESLLKALNAMSGDMTFGHGTETVNEVKASLNDMLGEVTDAEGAQEIAEDYARRLMATGVKPSNARHTAGFLARAVRGMAAMDSQGATPLELYRQYFADAGTRDRLAAKNAEQIDVAELRAFLTDANELRLVLQQRDAALLAGDTETATVLAQYAANMAQQTPSAFATKAYEAALRGGMTREQMLKAHDVELLTAMKRGRMFQLLPYMQMVQAMHRAGVKPGFAQWDLYNGITSLPDFVDAYNLFIRTPGMTDAERVALYEPQVVSPPEQFTPANQGVSETTVDGKEFLNIFYGADKSTAPHETGHLLLQVIGRMYDANRLSTSVSGPLMEYLGLKDLSHATLQRNVDAHELFAEAVERMLWEGRTGPLYSALRAGLRATYTDPNQIGAERRKAPDARQKGLDSAIRRVFGLLLDGDAAAQAAAESVGDPKLADDPLVQQAVEQEAREIVQDQEAALTEVDEGVLSDIRDSILQDPAWALYSDLTEGGEDGEPLYVEAASMERHNLDAEAMPPGVVQENGAQFEAVAAAAGFDSVQDAYKALQELRNPNTQAWPNVDDMVRHRVAEQHGVDALARMNEAVDNAVVEQGMPSPGEAEAAVKEAKSAEARQVLAGPLAPLYGTAEEMAVFIYGDPHYFTLPALNQHALQAILSYVHEKEVAHIVARNTSRDRMHDLGHTVFIDGVEGREAALELGLGEYATHEGRFNAFTGKLYSGGVEAVLTDAEAEAMPYYTIIGERAVYVRHTPADDMQTRFQSPSPARGALEALAAGAEAMPDAIHASVPSSVRETDYPPTEEQFPGELDVRKSVVALVDAIGQAVAMEKQAAMGPQPAGAQPVEPEPVKVYDPAKVLPESDTAEPVESGAEVAVFGNYDVAKDKLAPDGVLLAYVENGPDPEAPERWQDAAALEDLWRRQNSRPPRWQWAHWSRHDFPVAEASVGTDLAFHVAHAPPDYMVHVGDVEAEMQAQGIDPFADAHAHVPGEPYDDAYERIATEMADEIMKSYLFDETPGNYPYVSGDLPTQTTAQGFAFRLHNNGILNEEQVREALRVIGDVDQATAEQPRDDWLMVPHKRTRELMEGLRDYFGGVLPPASALGVGTSAEQTNTELARRAALSRYLLDNGIDGVSYMTGLRHPVYARAVLDPSKLPQVTKGLRWQQRQTLQWLRAYYGSVEVARAVAAVKDRGLTGDALVAAVAEELEDSLALAGVSYAKDAFLPKETFSPNNFGKPRWQSLNEAHLLREYEHVARVYSNGNTTGYLASHDKASFDRAYKAAGMQALDAGILAMHETPVEDMGPRRLEGMPRWQRVYHYGAPGFAERDLRGFPDLHMGTYPVDNFNRGGRRLIELELEGDVEDLPEIDDHNDTGLTSALRSLRDKGGISHEAFEAYVRDAALQWKQRVATLPDNERTVGHRWLMVNEVSTEPVEAIVDFLKYADNDIQVAVAKRHGLPTKFKYENEMERTVRYKGMQIEQEELEDLGLPKAWSVVAFDAIGLSVAANKAPLTRWQRQLGKEDDGKYAPPDREQMPIGKKQKPVLVEMYDIWELPSPRGYDEARAAGRVHVDTSIRFGTVQGVAGELRKFVNDVFAVEESPSTAPPNAGQGEMNSYLSQEVARKFANIDFGDDPTYSSVYHKVATALNAALLSAKSRFEIWTQRFEAAGWSYFKYTMAARYMYAATKNIFQTELDLYQSALSEVLIRAGQSDELRRIINASTINPQYVFNVSPEDRQRAHSLWADNRDKLLDAVRDILRNLSLSGINNPTDLKQHIYDMLFQYQHLINSNNQDGLILALYSVVMETIITHTETSGPPVPLNITDFLKVWADVPDEVEAFYHVYRNLKQFPAKGALRKDPTAAEAALVKMFPSVLRKYEPDDVPVQLFTADNPIEATKAVFYLPVSTTQDMGNRPVQSDIGRKMLQDITRYNMKQDTDPQLQAKREQVREVLRTIDNMFTTSTAYAMQGGFGSRVVPDAKGAPDGVYMVPVVVQSQTPVVVDADTGAVDWSHTNLPANIEALGIGPPLPFVIPPDMEGREQLLMQVEPRFTEENRHTFRQREGADYPRVLENTLRNRLEDLVDAGQPLPAEALPTPGAPAQGQMRQVFAIQVPRRLKDKERRIVEIGARTREQLAELKRTRPAAAYEALVDEIFRDEMRNAYFAANQPNPPEVFEGHAPAGTLHPFEVDELARDFAGPRIREPEKRSALLNPAYMAAYDSVVVMRGDKVEAMYIIAAMRRVKALVNNVDQATAFGQQAGQRSGAPSWYQPDMTEVGKQHNLMVVSLDSQEKLEREGHAMKHCIGTYADRCATNHSGGPHMAYHISNGEEAVSVLYSIGNLEDAVVPHGGQMTTIRTNNQVEYDLAEGYMRRVYLGTALNNLQELQEQDSNEDIAERMNEFREEAVDSTQEGRVALREAYARYLKENVEEDAVQELFRDYTYEYYRDYLGSRPDEDVDEYEDDDGEVPDDVILPAEPFIAGLDDEFTTSQIPDGDIRMEMEPEIQTLGDDLLVDYLLRSHQEHRIREMVRDHPDYDWYDEFQEFEDYARDRFRAEHDRHFDPDQGDDESELTQYSPYEYDNEAVWKEIWQDANQDGMTFRSHDLRAAPDEVKYAFSDLWDAWDNLKKNTPRSEDGPSVVVQEIYGPGDSSPETDLREFAENRLAPAISKATGEAEKRREVYIEAGEPINVEGMYSHGVELFDMRNIRWQRSPVPDATNEVLNAPVRELGHGLRRMATVAKTIQQGRRLTQEGKHAQAVLTQERALKQVRRARAEVLARREKTKLDKVIKRFTRATRKDQRTTMDRSYLALGRAVLSNHAHAKIEDRIDVQRLLSMLDQLVASGVPIDYDEDLIRSEVPMSEMTWGQYKQTAHTVKSIQHQALARARHKRKEVHERVKELAKGMRTPPRKDREKLNAWFRKLRDTGDAFFGFLRKPEHLWRELDGGVMGPIWRAIQQPLEEAENSEVARREAEDLALKALFRKHAGTLKGLHEKTDFLNGSVKLTKQERLAVALNSGNQGNVQAMLNGSRPGWTEALVEAVKKTLTDAEWQFVEEVWTYLERFREESFRLDMRTKGVRPVEVEAKGFVITTADGKRRHVRGGYYPIKFDPATFATARDEAEARAKELMSGGYAGSFTKQGSLMKRVGSRGSGKRVQLTLDTVYQHVQERVHDLAYREKAIEVAKLINSRAFQHAVAERFGSYMPQYIVEWFNAVIAGPRIKLDGAESAMRMLRVNMSVAELGFSARTAVSQLLGVGNVLAEIGPARAAQGIALYLAGWTSAQPWLGTQFVWESSPQMRARVQVFDRELADALPAGLDAHAVTKAVKGLRQASWAFMRLFDTAVSHSAWLGAYKQAIAQGMSHQDAVHRGDQVVRVTQGSGHVKDLSIALSRPGEGWKLLTSFMTSLSAFHNQLTDVYRKVHREGWRGTPEALAHTVFLLMGPALLWAMFFEEREEDHEWYGHFLREMGMYSVSGIPIIRDIGSQVLGGFEPKYPGGIRGLALAGGSLREFGKLLSGEEAFEDVPSWRDTIMASGYLGGLPTRQAYRTLDALVQYGEREYDGTRALLEGTGLRGVARNFEE